MARDTFACCHWSCYWYLVSRGQDAQDGSASHKHNMSVMSRVRGSPGTHVPQDLETCLRVFMVALQQQKQTHVCACVLSRVRLFVAPWTVAHQAPLSMGFSRQECWSGLPCPPPGGLPDPGIKPMSPASPAVQADSLLLSQTHRDAYQITGETHIRIFTAQTTQRTASRDRGMNTPAVSGQSLPWEGVSRSCVCLPWEPWRVYKSLSILGFLVSLTIHGKFYPIWSFLSNLGNSSKGKNQYA